MGPPGTGKTYTTAQMALTVLEEYPESRVLVLGNTHRSVDEMIQKVHQIFQGDREKFILEE
jgi:DNA replication protein DnaC